MLIVRLLGNFTACTREKYIPMVYFEVQVRDRVVRIYRTSRHTHARMNRNELSCQSRSRVASGPPSLTGLTGLTGPRDDLDRKFLRRPEWVRMLYTEGGRYEYQNRLFWHLLAEPKKETFARLRRPHRWRQGTSAAGSSKSTSTRIH